MVHSGRSRASHASRQISRAASWLAGTASALGLGFAGYATLKTDNEIGTAAAFVAALFFSVVAMTGRVPRIKVGDSEIDPASWAAGAAAGAEITAGVAQDAAETTKDAKAVAGAADAAAEEILRRVQSISLIGGPDDHWRRLTVTGDFPTTSADLARWLEERAAETNLEVVDRRRRGDFGDGGE